MGAGSPGRELAQDQRERKPVWLGSDIRWGDAGIAITDAQVYGGWSNLLRRGLEAYSPEQRFAGRSLPVWARNTYYTDE